MVEIMKHLASSDQELTVEERNLIAVAYRNVVCAHRASWRMVLSVEQKEESKGNRAQGSITKYYREKIWRWAVRLQFSQKIEGATAHLHLLRRDRPRGFSGATPHWKLPPWSDQMAFVLTSSLVWDWMFALRRSLWACSLLKAIDRAVTVEKLFTSECIMWQTEVLSPVFEWRTLLRLIRSIYWGTANTNNNIYSRTQPILTMQHSHDTILSYPYPIRAEVDNRYR